MGGHAALSRQGTTELNWSVTDFAPRVNHHWEESTPMRFALDAYLQRFGELCGMNATRLLSHLECVLIFDSNAHG